MGHRQVHPVVHRGVTRRTMVHHGHHGNAIMTHHDAEWCTMIYPRSHGSPEKAILMGILTGLMGFFMGPMETLH